MINNDQMLRAANTYVFKYNLSVIPINMNNKKPALSSWKKYQTEIANADELKSWWCNKSNNGIGIVTGTLSNLAVIDIDDYGEAIPVLNEVIPNWDKLNVPTSQTPSGGKHLCFTCLSDKLRNNQKVLPGCDLRAEGGYVIAPPSPGYKWLCKLSYGLSDLPQAYFDYINHKSAYSSDLKNNSAKNFFAYGERDANLFTVANSLIKAGQPKEFAENVLTRIISSWGEVDPKWVKTKVESAYNRHVNIELINEIREYVMSTKGTFLSIDVHRELGLSTRVQRKNCSEYLRRMIRDGIIERVGSKNGQFRRIEAELDRMNWQDADETESYDLKLPLDLHTLMDFNAGSIILLAGVKNSGKTAFALTTALLNPQHDVRYLNSEMGNVELKKRLMGFPDITEDSWKHVTFYNRASNYADAIEPDQLTIIDFLEISASEGFYTVVDVIKAIHDKIILGKGLVLICMQKKPGAENATGGVFTTEKARAVFNMEFQEIEIKHCKSPKFGVNVHGKKIGFILRDGNTFMRKE